MRHRVPASGRSTCITRRHIKNNRLATAARISAFAAATRHLFNKFLGQLYHCLQHGQIFNEDKAFPDSAVAAALPRDY
jgi:hypothetical protein